MSEGNTPGADGAGGRVGAERFENNYPKENVATATYAEQIPRVIEKVGFIHSGGEFLELLFKAV